MRKVVLKETDAVAPVEIGLKPAGRETPDTWEVTVGDRALTVEIVWIGPDAASVRIDGRVYPMRATRDGDRIALWLDGRTWSVDEVPRTAQRSAGADEAAAGNELTAPMPGKVLQIAAKPGASFEADATLILLESMKMEMAISAPTAGTVREVLCAEGDLVEMGQILARLESAGATS